MSTRGGQAPLRNGRNGGEQRGRSNSVAPKGANGTRAGTGTSPGPAKQGAAQKPSPPSLYPLRPHLTFVNVAAAVVNLGLVVGGCVLLAALADAMWGATHITYVRVVDWSAIAAGGVASACVAMLFLAWRYNKAQLQTDFDAATLTSSADENDDVGVGANADDDADEDEDEDDAAGAAARRQELDTAALLADAGPKSAVSEGGGADPQPRSSHMLRANRMSWSRAAVALLHSVFTRHSQRRLRAVTLMALGAVVLASLAKQDAEVAKVAATVVDAGIGGGDDDDDAAATAEAMALRASALRRAEVQVATALVLLAIVGLVLVGTLVRIIINVTALLVMHLSGCVCERTRAAVKRLPACFSTPSARVLFRACVCVLVITVLVLVQTASWGSLTVYNNAEAVTTTALLLAATWGTVMLGCATSSAAGAARDPTHGLASDVGLPEATALALLLTAVMIQVSVMDAAEATAGSLRLTVLTALAVATTLHLGVVVVMGAESMLFATLRMARKSLGRLHARITARSRGNGNTANRVDAESTRLEERASAGIAPLRVATFMAVGALGVLCVVLGFMGAPGIINIHNVHAASGLLFVILLAVGVFAVVATIVLLARVPSDDAAHVHEMLQHSAMVMVFAVVAAWPILWTTNSVTGTVSGLTLLLLAGAQTLGSIPWKPKTPPSVAV